MIEGRIRKGITPFEGLTTGAEGIDGIFEELDFDPGHIWCNLELTHFLFSSREQFSIEFGGLFMIRIPVVVLTVSDGRKRERYVKVSFQWSTASSLLIPGIRRTLFLVSIAIIPLTPMLTPRPHTNPTKLVSTLSTRHMIASAILLDCGTALWAFLGVRRYPICCLGIVLALFEPFFDEGT